MFDVIIIGAGISGIAAAYYTKKSCSDLNFAVLEAEDTFGGTWITNNFPGVRTDSDMFTFSYSFKPWDGNSSIATASEILSYMGETIRENDLESNIQYDRQVKFADWSSEDRCWILKTYSESRKETLTFKSRFLFMCQGYYRHREGYTPYWPSRDSFKGIIAHPQNWPENLYYKNKDVVVVGSGSTAATMVPAMAKDARHVTMLQRTPTFFYPQQVQDELSVELKKINVSDELYHDLMRQKFFKLQEEQDKKSRECPEAMRNELLGLAKEYLPDDYPIEQNFNPPYRPWQQRVAILPDGDLFNSIASGSVSIITDQIKEFTANGIKLASGNEIDCDIVVTATGFNISMFGDIEFSRDGENINFSDTITYRGMMFTDVPNFVWVFGYYRYSWTPRAELVSTFVTRLLQYMESIGAKSVEPCLRPSDKDMSLYSWVDDDFNPGYLIRAKDCMPKQGDKPEWRHGQDYMKDFTEFPSIDLNDAIFSYGY